MEALLAAAAKARLEECLLAACREFLKRASLQTRAVRTISGFSLLRFGRQGRSRQKKQCLRLAAERTAAEPALAEMLAADPAGRLRRINNEARFRTIALGGLLLERSQAALASLAYAEAEDLASFAGLILERIEGEEKRPALLAELRVCAWGLVARACWEAQRWDTVMWPSSSCCEPSVWTSPPVPQRSALGALVRLEADGRS